MCERQTETDDDDDDEDDGGGAQTDTIHRFKEKKQFEQRLRKN